MISVDVIAPDALGSSDELTQESCGVRAWHPGIDCLGTPWLVEIQHPLLGSKWACLPHSIHLLEQVPDARITAALDMSIADDIRSRANPRRPRVRMADR
jgi:hypothetical protein